MQMFTQVIDYIQFLQEKVQKFEGSYPGWNQEPSKLIPWVIPKFITISSMLFALKPKMSARILVRSFSFVSCWT